jgi:DNA mismatch repair protein MutS
LHDLVVNNLRLEKLSNIKMYHLRVDYNEATNTIRYDRTLTEGSGDNFYGLNVAKYLMADDDFMKMANEIKKEMFEIPDLLVDKKSKYNANLYIDHCQICLHQPKKGQIPLETHHIVWQKDFIDGVSKSKFYLQINHKSNLVVLCTKCHDQIDSGHIEIKGWICTNQTDKLDWSYI